MTISQIKLLTCPYCQKTFKKNKILILKNETIKYGTVYCECDEFPIIEKILVIDKKKAKIVSKLIKEGKTKEALIKSIIPFKEKFIYKILGIETMLKLLLSILLNDNLLKKNSYVKYLLTLLTTKNEANYQINRKKEYDSILIFLPTLLLKKRNNIQWLNLGSGLMNFYPEIHKFYSKEITFISVEKSFILQFFSGFLNKKVSKNKEIKICTDSSIGKLTTNKNDVVTLIDTIPFLENQRNQVKVAEDSVKKDGILYISGLMEHMYLSPGSHCFPILINTFNKYFSRKTIILNELKLLNQIRKNSIKIEDIIKKDDDKIAKYSVLLTAEKKKLKDTQKLPRKIIKQAQYHYGHSDKSFTNKVY